MAYLTDYEYFSDSSNHGKYQYISVKDIINNYMSMYVGEDQVVDNVPVHKVRFEAKQTIKELNYDAFKSTRVVEDTIQSDLRYIMPSDYVDVIRMSVLRNGVLHPMMQNRNVKTAEVYLRDNANEILFDNNGEILLANSSSLEQSGISGTPNIQSSSDGCGCYPIGVHYGMDTATANANPTYRINQRSGVINFDSTMAGETIVLEYISDGMEGGDDSLIVVNKFFEKYVYANITFEILDSKVNIADNIKTRWRQKRRALLRNARIRIGNHTPIDLLMTLRGSNNWNKG